MIFPVHFCFCAHSSCYLICWPDQEEKENDRSAGAVLSVYVAVYPILHTNANVIAAMRARCCAARAAAVVGAARQHARLGQVQAGRSSIYRAFYTPDRYIWMLSFWYTFCIFSLFLRSSYIFYKIKSFNVCFLYVDIISKISSIFLPRLLPLPFCFYLQGRVKAALKFCIWPS